MFIIKVCQAENFFPEEMLDTFYQEYIRLISSLRPGEKSQWNTQIAVQSHVNLSDNLGARIICSVFGSNNMLVEENTLFTCKRL